MKTYLTKERKLVIALAVKKNFEAMKEQNMPFKVMFERYKIKISQSLIDQWSDGSRPVPPKLLAALYMHYDLHNEDLLLTEAEKHKYVTFRKGFVLPDVSPASWPNLSEERAAALVAALPSGLKLAKLKKQKRSAKAVKPAETEVDKKPAEPEVDKKPAEPKVDKKPAEKDPENDSLEVDMASHISYNMCFHIQMLISDKELLANVLKKTNFRKAMIEMFNKMIKGGYYNIQLK